VKPAVRDARADIARLVSRRSDAELLADRDGLRELYERRFDAIFRYAAARIGRQVAEDVVAARRFRGSWGSRRT
jgi:hypothetical protein